MGTANRQKRRNAQVINKDQTERGDIRPPLGLISIGNSGTVSLLTVDGSHLASGGPSGTLPGATWHVASRWRSHAVRETAPVGRYRPHNRANFR